METTLLNQLIEDSAPVVEKPPPSDFFVTCFSAVRDDLSQWRAYGGGENGYAIAFGAGGFFNRGSLVARINYDRELHVELASKAAEATLRFFREGLNARSGEDATNWPKEFVAEWFRLLGRLTPMLKDSAFKGENEYRIVHTYVTSEMRHLRFRQKQSMMSMHLSLSFPPTLDVSSQMLPILEAMVGPSRHKNVSCLSAQMLLQQNGYHNVRVTTSETPFQST